MPPCFSVIMPAYNEEATIAEVIPAVLRQVEVLELIINNDASRDGTKSVFDKIQLIDPHIGFSSEKSGRGSFITHGYHSSHGRDYYSGCRS